MMFVFQEDDDALGSNKDVARGMVVLAILGVILYLLSVHQLATQTASNPHHYWQQVVQMDSSSL